MIALNLVFQLVSVLGAGLLVGTALSVIIPEGMETLNMAYRYERNIIHNFLVFNTVYVNQNSIKYEHLM